MMKTTISQCAAVVFLGMLLVVLSIQSPQPAQAAGPPGESAKKFAPRGA